MKPRPKPKPRPEQPIIAALVILLHLSCGLCLHLNNVTEPQTAIRISAHNRQLSSWHSSTMNQHRTVNSHLINRTKFSSSDSFGGESDIAIKSYPARLDDESQSDLNDTPIELLQTHHYDLVLPPPPNGIDDYDVRGESDMAFDVTDKNNDTSLRAGSDHPQVMDEGEVWTLIDKVASSRNHNRIRRQRSSDTQKSVSSDSTHRRRKRKRRHRLLLKSRARNGHLANSQESRKGRRRKNFILKSDSEGHVITSASEVKKDWCRTVPFTQKVTAPNCKTKTIVNNFCYGQCNSFFIPQQKSFRGEAFQSYSNCKPDRLRWGNVTLDCPDQNPPVVQKTILIVDSCRCIASDEKQLNKNIRHHTRGNKSQARLLKKQTGEKF